MAILEIGLPPVFTSAYVDEHELAKESLLSLTIEPREASFISPGQDGAFRIFSLGPPVSKGAPSPMKIYFEPTQIQETFTNEMTEHFLSQILRSSERLGQVFQSLGVTGKQAIEAGKQIGSQYLGFASKFIPDVIKNVGSNLGSAIGAVLTGSRFDFPKMWTDSRAELNYEITTKLYCNNPNSDNEFEKYIIKPIENLLKFVLPKAKTKDHYEWPFFCKVNAPGLFNLPEAIVSSISVNKGTGVNFGVNNRPNYVELSISFMNIRNVMVNDASEPSTVLPYTLSKYTRNLKDKRSVYNIKNLKTANASGTTGQRGINRNVSNNQLTTFNNLANVYPNQGGLYG